MPTHHTPRPAEPAPGRWTFGIDRGGTFTDLVALDPLGRLRTAKLLSENPDAYDDAALEGIRRLMGLGPGEAVDAAAIEAIRMGTTVATNALLERKGEPTLLLVPRGLEEGVRIGDQARPRLFDLDVRLPPLLHARVAGVRGRVAPDGTVLEELDEDEARASLRAGRAAGCTACAIALLHAWAHPAMELRLAELAREAGFDQVTTGHEASPLVKWLGRADTAVADAYLSPVLRRHVDRLASKLPGVPLYFMQSNGGLARADAFRGKDAILSGPAGGIVGAARTGEADGFDRVIGFDMGGTSTDVALYDQGFERSFETMVAGVRIRAPMMAIHTVAAGGGSILSFDGERFRAGPESAGAIPGPACYRRGGPLTVTDANVALGRIQPAHFPSVFGPSGDQKLDARPVREGFAQLAASLPGRSAEQVAEGFLSVAVASMANAIKRVSLARGVDPARFALACFGGAGGQHACPVADAIGMDTVLVHPLAGVLSAHGMGLADQTVQRAAAIETPFRPDALPAIARAVEANAAEARRGLQAQAANGTVVVKASLALRVAGTDTALDLPWDLDSPPGFEALEAAFASLHRTRFGFAPEGAALVAEAARAEAVSPGRAASAPALPQRDAGRAPEPIDHAALWVEGGFARVPVFDRDLLLAGDRIQGPALIAEANATTVLDPGWAASVLASGMLVLRRTAPRPRAVVQGAEDAPDPVRLELMANRFMAIADAMGEVLRNTARSVNIKERLDFSCALFSAHGALVANAPHVPVHLGSMGESVRTVLASRGASLKPGDVVALNNPYRGGTHLPDITLVTPVFGTGDARIAFVASRGHHADVGGITPGSMPPLSRSLEEEGVRIDDFLLVDGGRMDEAGFRALLEGARYPARSPDMNLADIRAQIAANEQGVQELARLVDEAGEAAVLAYMGHVQDNAARAVARLLGRLQDGSFAYRMDNGDPLHVAVRIDRDRARAVVDFTGTGAQRADNFNAPPAVTRAAVLYVLRCLVGEDIPLNDGCLEGIELVLPEGSFLSPRPPAAVVAGNVEVSQAVCNALLGALGASASAQATMNNLTFGDAAFQYYETIAGGMGAGPGWNGASGVQTHMTNTRMTDPEVLEMRLPVRVETFGLRHGSGGAGRFRGGDGVVRRLRFLRSMGAVVLSSRREVAPFGLAGGLPGAPGRQWIERADGSVQWLSGVERATLEPGDAIVIETPGGGGYGPAG